MRAYFAIGPGLRIVIGRACMLMSTQYCPLNARCWILNVDHDRHASLHRVCTPAILESSPSLHAKPVFACAVRTGGPGAGLACDPPVFQRVLRAPSQACPIPSASESAAGVGPVQPNCGYSPLPSNISTPCGEHTPICPRRF